MRGFSTYYSRKDATMINSQKRMIDVANVQVVVIIHVMVGVLSSKLTCRLNGGCSKEKPPSLPEGGSIQSAREIDV